LINTIAISQDCRFLVSGSSDQLVKVFDLQTGQQVQSYASPNKKPIVSIAITSDNKWIISAPDSGVIRMWKLTPTPPLPSKSDIPSLLTKGGFDVSASEIYYGNFFLNELSDLFHIVYHGFSHYASFNAVDDFLFDRNIPVELACDIAQRCSNLTVHPYQWNILHLVAIKGYHTFIKNMPEYSQFRVPFLLDTFNKTPLHYLIAHEKINSASINFMLNYICDYLEGLSKYQRYQGQEIIISLTPLFWFILNKADTKIQVRFFKICSRPPPIPYNAELPSFGRPITDSAYFHATLESIQDSLPSMLENGEEQIEFRANLVNLDYDVLSRDMEKAISRLSKQKNEEIFKITLIIDLINHLWDQTKLFLQIKFLIFSAYIIGLSVYLTQEDRTLPYEIIILCCAGVFLFFEGLQVATVKLNYLKDPWNWIDMIFHPLTIAYIIARMLGNEDELARAWISTIIILFGYLRWILPEDLQTYQKFDTSNCDCGE